MGSLNIQQFPKVNKKQKKSMQQSYFDFRNVDSPTSASNMVQLFKQGAYIDGVFQKIASQKYISQLYHYLQSQNGSPKSKFYSLMSLKDIILMNDLKIIGLLSSSSQLFQLFQKIGITVDAKKNITEKGKNYFNGDKDGWGNKFINLVLEIVVYLGTKYSATSKSQPTRFRKVLMKLQSQGVVLPTQPSYMPKLKPSARPDSRAPAAEAPGKKASEPQKSSTPQPQPQQISPSSVESLLQFYKDKIDIYFQQIDQAQDIDETRKIILQNHDKFIEYLPKIEPIGITLQNGIPGKNQQQVTELFNLYFNLVTFFQNQKLMFEKHCEKNHFDLYYDEIMIKYEEIFQEDKGKDVKKKTSKNITKSKINSEIAKSQSNAGKQKLGASGKDNGLPPPELYKAPQMNKAPEPYKAPDLYKPPSVNSGENQMQRAASVKDQQNPKSLIKNLMQRLQDKPVSPFKGFSQIRRSLQKQKSLIHTNPPNRYASKSPTTVKNPLTGSRVRTSTINSIFHNPPNLSPPPKSYPGIELPPNPHLQQILYQIPLQQSCHRFQKSLICTKSVLYQSQALQIGIKTQPIFEDCEELDYVIAMELFFGNKTKGEIWGVQARFQGAEDEFVLYTLPRELPSTIAPQTQNKYQLMLVPKSLSFTILKMRLSYSSPSSTTPTRTTVYLPTSVLKLSIPQPISLPSFLSGFGSATSFLHTRACKLSKQLPPQKVRKYFANSVQVTKYSQFCVDGGAMDYQLGYLVEVGAIYEMYVKICIRPNMDFVVVVGVESQGDQVRQYAKAYAEGVKLALIRNQ